MIFVVITILLITIYLLIRLLSYKKELRKLIQQLNLYNARKTDKKMHVSLSDQDIENIGFEINALIDLHVKEYQERVRLEAEQKQVISNMSHDLRTPLTSILGSIQMAESDDINEEERKELLLTAKQRAKRLESLIKDFFELSVIESKDYHIKKEQINFNSLMTDVLMSFYDLMKEKDLEPIINVPDDDLYIKSDESAVIRVIENIISNAINHSDGNIIVSVEEKASKVRLIVKNDTYLLTESDVDHIFNRFYMADQSRSKHNAGLGMSIAKSLMEKMNGTISADLKNKKLSIICEWKME